MPPGAVSMFGVNHDSLRQAMMKRGVTPSEKEEEEEEPAPSQGEADVTDAPGEDLRDRAKLKTPPAVSNKSAKNGIISFKQSF